MARKPRKKRPVDPMPDAELEQIRRRCERLLNPRLTLIDDIYNGKVDLQRLIVEVDRLRARVAELEKPPAP